MLERPHRTLQFSLFSLFLFPILLGWFDPENRGTVVIYIAHGKDQQSLKEYCSVTCASHRYAQTCHKCGLTGSHLLDTSASSYFYQTDVPDLVLPNLFSVHHSCSHEQKFLFFCKFPLFKVKSVSIKLSITQRQLVLSLYL